jgi:hypothetical protein
MERLAFPGKNIPYDFIHSSCWQRFGIDYLKMGTSSFFPKPHLTEPAFFFPVQKINHTLRLHRLTLQQR